MTTRRHKTETTQIQIHRSNKNLNIENHHFFQQNRKKYKFSNVNLHSLHSIDTKRSSINLYQNVRMKNNQRRRQLSIPINQPKHILLTQRPEVCEVTSKKFSENRCIPSMRLERKNTIDDEVLQDKQKKIKNCIQLMCGVLQEIRNQKSTHKASKSKIVDQFTPNHYQQPPKTKEENGEGEGRFQNYIKNITKLKESNKIILIKRGKSKSIVNNENIPNANVNSKSFLIKEKYTPRLSIVQIKKTIQPTHIHASPAPASHVPAHQLQLPLQKPPKVNQHQHLSQISCSSIEKGNQSSFVSEFSRQSFMKNILEDGGKGFASDKQIQSRKITKIKNSKQLKQLFPIDFF